MRRRRLVRPNVEGGGPHSIRVAVVTGNRYIGEGHLRRVRFARGWRYHVVIDTVYGYDPVTIYPHDWLEVRIDVTA